jgi:hypothetical protein
MDNDGQERNRWFGGLRMTRMARVLTGIAAAATVAACSMETATSPVSDVGGEISANVLPGAERLAWGLSRTTPLTKELRASARFTSKGGTLTIKELGVTLTVPMGAIPRDTMTITMTAIAGGLVAYDLQPHGTVFRKSLTLSHKLKGATYDPARDGRFGGYFTDRSKIDHKARKIRIAESVAPTIANGSFSYSISHFSGWMVSTGFTDEM